MRRIIAIVVSIVIVIFTMASVIYTVNFSSRNSPVASNGWMDLSTWNFKEQGAIKLKGEWEFYRDELIVPVPDQNIFDDYTDVKEIERIPKLWKVNALPSDYDFTVATYRLVIQVPEDDSYIMKTNSIRHANALYVDGEPINAASAEKNTIAFKKRLGLVDSKDNEIEIVAHVVQRNHPGVGMIQAIDLGLSNQMLLKNNRNIVLDALQISGFLLLGIYYFGSFFQSGKGSYPLFFSLYCFLQGIYASTLNERLFQFFFTEIDWFTLIHMQLFLVQASVLFFLLFTIDTFAKYTHKRATAFVITLLCMSLILLGIPSVKMFVFQQNAIFFTELLAVIVIGIANFYIITIMLKVIRHKKVESEYLLIVVTTFICYGLLYALNFLVGIEISYLPLFLFLIMTISLSWHMGRRFQLANFEIEQLTRDLLLYNQLEHKSLEKTTGELQAPLQVVMTLTQSLLEGHEGPLREKQQKSVMKIHKIGEQLMNTLEDLVSISKRDDVDRLFNPTAIHLNVIKEIIKEIMYLKLLGAGVTIRYEIDENMPLVYMDEYRLKQIMFNLLNNATKYTHEGEIVISSKVQDDKMHVSIKDTGIGIQTEEIAYIFEPFYQADSTKNKIPEGLGIGLSIVKQLVELSGGDIWVKSEYGKGSCFTFTIPLAVNKQTSEQAQQITAVSKTEVQFPRKLLGSREFTILVVHKHHEELEELQNFINTLHFTVIAVDHGQEAIAQLKKQPIDLVIIDSLMSEMAGYEVCEMIRLEYKMIELPIINLSSGAKSADLMMTIQAGANGFLRKPFLLEELKVKIESFVLIKQASQKALHDELSYFYAQIAPHFLYNTLNTIISLTYQDVKKAREALYHLTTYFRAKLDYYKYNTTVSLIDELELVYSYIAIEQLRFGEKLKVHYEIDETINFKLPSMTIQPFVENAIQHGISPKSEGGSLFMSIQQIAEGTEIIVEDDGVGMSEEKLQSLLNDHTAATGIGFVNSFQKLKLVKNTQFILESELGKGTRVTIILPGGIE